MDTNIQQPIQPVQTPPTADPIPDHGLRFTKYLWVFLAIFVAITAIGSTAYFLNRNQTKQIAQTTSSPTPTPDPTANWKTYNSSDYSIKYPPSWEYSSGKLGIVFGPAPLVTVTDSFQMVISIQSGAKNPPLITGDARNKIESKKEINVNRVKGEQALFVDGTNEENFLQTVVVNNGKTFYFNSNFPKERSTYDQILSTFKFTQ